MAKKYEYAYVRLEFIGLLRKEPDYKKVIEEYAQKGWQLKQIFTYTTLINNCSDFFELIFEREVE